MGIQYVIIDKKNVQITWLGTAMPKTTLHSVKAADNMQIHTRPDIEKHQVPTWIFHFLFFIIDAG